MNNRNFFLRYFSGQWLLQNNLFLFQRRINRKSKQNVNLNNIRYNLLYANNFFNTQNRVDHIISYRILSGSMKSYSSSKPTEDTNVFYSQKCFFYSETLQKGLLKIIKINYKKRVIQYEYIYLASCNLMISINLIKNFKGRYLGIKISSYIRKRIKTQVPD